MRTIFRIFSYIKRYRGLATAQVVFAILATLLVLVYPKIIEVIIDDVIRGGKRELLGPMIALAVGAFFLRELFDSLRIQLNNIFEQKVVYDLRSDLYEHIQRLPLDWFDHRPTGDTMTCVSEDVQSMERVLIDGVEQGVISILQIVAVGTMMFLINPSLAAASLAPIPFLVAGAYIYTRGRKRYKLLRDRTGEMNSLLHDNIAGIRQIKGYALEESEHQRFNEFSGRVKEAVLRVMRAWSIYKPGMAFLNSLGRVIVLGYGAILVFQENLTDGELVSFLLLVSLYFYEPISRLHQLNQLFQSGFAAGERVFAVLDHEPELDLADGENLEQVQGEVIFDQVSFSYTDRVATLTGVSLRAEPGQTIALVGPTGAGKSTVIQLLARFYESEEGRIAIDGKSVRDLNKQSLRSQIGYVTQESFLFNGTVRDNPAIATREARESELWAALAVANAKEFVEKLPDGLDTEVGERGVRLRRSRPRHSLPAWGRSIPCSSTSEW
ncbi:MAG: ABC transporter ATP-binding protein, partial [Verrucomicrobiota bacterium]